MPNFWLMIYLLNLIILIMFYLNLFFNTNFKKL